MSEDLLDLVDSWRIALIAANKARPTVATYTNSARMFLAWCAENDTEPMTRAAIRGFIAHCLQDGSEPATARLRHYSLKAFCSWLLAEGEIDADPFVGLRPPRMDEKVVPALPDDDIKTLLGTCRGSGFIDRRDGAILRLMFDSGIRSHELCAMRVADVSLTAMTATVVRGKGGKGRVVPFSAPTAAAIDRYLRARKTVAAPGVDRLWVSSTTGRGIGYQGMYFSLKSRARKVGLPDFRPHRTRHTAATRWLRHGGSEAGLMAIAGWSSRAMLDRYTAASATERAIAEARGLGLGFSGD